MTILIIGAGAIGRVVMDAIEKSGTYRIAGFLDDALPVGSEVSGYKVLGNISDMERIAKDICKGIIAVGDNWQRSEIARKIKNISKKFHFVRIIHPMACVARDVQIGEGAVLLAGTIVSSNAVIGKHAYLFIGSILDHDSELMNYACMLPGAKAGGNVRIGEYSGIGLGANIIHGIKIGNHSFIDAGATVVSDIPSNVLAGGIPATVVRRRRRGEHFL